MPLVQRAEPEVSCKCANYLAPFLGYGSCDTGCGARKCTLKHFRDWAG
jgi:hypothetical protein